MAAATRTTRRGFNADQRNHTTARFNPMKARNGRWSLVTSASGKIVDVGAIAIQNHTMPNATGRYCFERDALAAAYSENSRKARPASRRQFMSDANGLMSVSAVTPVGRKYIRA